MSKMVDADRLWRMCGNGHTEIVLAPKSGPKVARWLELQLWLDKHDEDARAKHRRGEPSGFNLKTDSCECDLCNHVEAELFRLEPEVFAP